MSHAGREVMRPLGIIASVVFGACSAPPAPRSTPTTPAPVAVAPPPSAAPASVIHETDLDVGEVVLAVRALGNRRTKATVIAIFSDAKK